VSALQIHGYFIPIIDSWGHPLKKINHCNNIIIASISISIQKNKSSFFSPHIMTKKFIVHNYVHLHKYQGEFSGIVVEYKKKNPYFHRQTEAGDIAQIQILK
jgi:hypothetical protein